MDLKIIANLEARRATIWTDAETSPADLGKALDSIFSWPDFRPGIQVLEILRGAAGSETVSRAIRSLGHRARRLGLRRWAVVTNERFDGLTNRTWTGIAGSVIVHIAAFDSVIAALDWLSNETAHELACTPTPIPEAKYSRRSRFNAPSATGFHPAMIIPKSGGSGDITISRPVE